MKKRKMGLLAKIAIVVFTMYAAVTLLYLTAERNAKTAERDALLQQVNEQKLRVSIPIDSEWNDERIAKAAREKLGLINPGETMIIDVSQR